jgi:uncharacterized caspase-like protein
MGFSHFGSDARLMRALTTKRKKGAEDSVLGFAMRRVVFSLIGIMVVLLLPAMPSFAQERAVTRQDTARSATISERRLALLIGNSAYTQGGNLRNPVNDVRDMKAALEELGFRVIKHENCTQKAMKEAIDDFGEELRGHDVGLFFYAGHGVQVGGDNYLIPVDAKLQSEKVVEYDCVRADRVLAMMEGAGSKTNIVILDACRDNPFERSWRRGGFGRGLAFMNAPSGALIAYATAPGRTALDGGGRNGVYTEALLDHIKTAGITIEQMFKRVRVGVEDRTNRTQTPWESTSLRGDFYFLPGSIAAARVDAPEPSLAPDLIAEDRFAAIPKETTGIELNRITLRSTPELNLHENKLNKMIKDHNFFAKSYNPGGDFPNVFVDNGDGTVTDKVTGLMWQKEGSSSELTFDKAREYVKDLNANRLGGYADWRLPTIEELCSLLEPIQNKRGQYIDMIFAGSMYTCWSCDQLPRAYRLAHVVNFGSGDVDVKYIERFFGGNYLRERHFTKAVRTME